MPSGPKANGIMAGKKRKNKVLKNQIKGTSQREPCKNPKKLLHTGGFLSDLHGSLRHDLIATFGPAREKEKEKEERNGNLSSCLIVASFEVFIGLIRSHHRGILHGPDWPGQQQGRV
jgi:hypothetical protein